MKIIKDFTKEDTTIIKGVAIILMLMHHVWGFPNRIPVKLHALIGGERVMYIGLFGKICVPIFFFMGGYGLYICSKKDDFSVLNRIKKLYFSYWKVFLIMIPLGLIFFQNQPHYVSLPSIYDAVKYGGLENFLSNFFGIRNTWNAEWWFFRSYILCLVFFPFYKKISDLTKNNIYFDFGLIIMMIIALYNIFPYIITRNLFNLASNQIFVTIFCQNEFTVLFCLGMVFAKHNLIVKLYNEMISKLNLNIFWDFLIVLLTYIMFKSSFGLSSFIFMTPFFIICTLDIIKKFKIKKIFLIFGNHSTSMWLIHSFFCYYYYFFVKIVFLSNYSTVCLVILIILSLVSSIIIDLFWKYFKIGILAILDILKKSSLVEKYIR